MKIFGIGANYPQDGGGAGANATSPIVYLMADSALLKNGKPFFVPDWSSRTDYEAQVAVRICRLGKSIPQRFAHRYYDAVTVGINFCARHLQQQACADGLPWTIARGFDGAATIGTFLNIADVEQPLAFHLDVNSQTVQQGSTDELLFSIDALISHLSRFFTLRTGDLLFTGTPPGAGPAAIGDHLQGYIGQEKVLDFYCR